MKLCWKLKFVACVSVSVSGLAPAADRIVFSSIFVERAEENRNKTEYKKNVSKGNIASGEYTPAIMSRNHPADDEEDYMSMVIEEPQQKETFTQRKLRKQREVCATTSRMRGELPKN